jgi:anti-sigma regulatory factor (Ser/Thr protein kinase)
VGVRPGQAAVMARTTTSFPCEPSSVGGARHAVASFLEQEGCSGRGSETAGLLVSELATNAVRHAKTPFTVEMVHEPGTLEIEVGDGDPTMPRARAPDDEGGRGLRIVESLADGWGTRLRDSGKVVFFRVACSS